MWAYSLRRGPMTSRLECEMRCIPIMSHQGSLMQNAPLNCRPVANAATLRFRGARWFFVLIDLVRRRDEFVNAPGSECSVGRCDRLVNDVKSSQGQEDSLSRCDGGGPREGQIPRARAVLPQRNSPETGQIDYDSDCSDAAAIESASQPHVSCSDPICQNVHAGADNPESSPTMMRGFDTSMYMDIST